MFTFNVLITTVGRPSLVKMLDSLKDELLESDCLTIVFDGCKSTTGDLSEFKCKVNIFEEPIALGFYGHGIRNKYASLLEYRTFVMHADDDDVYFKGAFEILRNSCTNPFTLYIGKMLDHERNIIPKSEDIRKCNIGTPNGIIPYELNMKSFWKYERGGDGDFYECIKKEQDLLGNMTVFLPNIIYIVTCRPITWAD